MSAEIRSLRLGDGSEVKTPLLVPSFSSKGFGRVEDEKEIGTGALPIEPNHGPATPIRSEISEVLNYFASEQLTESMLVSAYDLSSGLLEAGDDWGASDWSASVLSRPEVLILDSGGYEVRVGSDGGEIEQDLSEPVIDWQEEDYAAFLDKLPEAASNVAAVSWDLPGVDYGSQIASAQAMLGARHSIASIVLLKPPVENGRHKFALLTPHAADLSAFAAIGVTEHELGEGLLDRVIGVMELRDLLKRSGINKPIHVFGALDPLYVPLFFAAGADIFDGLTWLRYAYWHGLSVHREQGGLLGGFTTVVEDTRRRAILTENLNTLERLKVQLQRFITEKDWNVFSDETIKTEDGSLGASLREAYLSASARRES